MRKNGTTLHLRATSFPTSNNLELKAEDYEATNSAVFQVAVTNTLNAACQAKFGTEDNQITAYNDDKVLARFSSTLGDNFTSNDIEDILIQVEDLSKELDDEKNFFDITNAKYNECLTNFQEGEEWYKIFFLLCEAKKFTSSTAKGEALLEKFNNIVQEQGGISSDNIIEIWNALRETEELKKFGEHFDEFRASWKSLRKFQSTKVNIVTTQGKKRITSYDIEGLKFTDIYEVMFLYICRNYLP